jgi:hypothetical protein
MEFIYRARLVETVEIPMLSRSGVLVLILGLAAAALLVLLRRPCHPSQSR